MNRGNTNELFEFLLIPILQQSNYHTYTTLLFNENQTLHDQIYSYRNMFDLVVVIFTTEKHKNQISILVCRYANEKETNEKKVIFITDKDIEIPTYLNLDGNLFYYRNGMFGTQLLNNELNKYILNLYSVT